jgi:glucose-6-phosphate isomerase
MTSDLLRFDTWNAFVTGDPLSSDLTPHDLEAIEPRLVEIARDIRRQRKQGGLAFMELHAETTLRQEIKDFAGEARERYEDIVVLGIGGSALGIRAVSQALLGLFPNMLPRNRREGPRLHVCDNVDPALIRETAALIDPDKTLLLVITKSGGTLETMAGLLYFYDLLKKRHGAGVNEHVVAITDPRKGLLRRLTAEQGWRSFPVPHKVGGRFSVFTPVGLVPLALAGVDIDGLLAGQAAIVESGFASTHPIDEPAFRLSAVAYLADLVGRRNQLVCLPYGDRLRESAFWFRQLWAESLGKALRLDGSPARVGTTPVFASGATDQHSQIQLYMEGPPNKLVLFLEVENPGADLTLPEPPEALAKLAYLQGRTFGELLSIELDATRDALTEAGKPNVSLVLPELNAPNLGALFFTLMAATTVAGALYDINPFDQPGVEAAKKKIKAVLGS